MPNEMKTHLTVSNDKISITLTTLDNAPYSWKVAYRRNQGWVDYCVIECPVMPVTSFLMTCETILRIVK